MAETDKTIETEAEGYIEKRNLLLKGVDPVIIRKAWFTLSHLLLEEGERVIDMGCDDGTMTYCMAAMNPKVKFTGLDKSKKQINKAKERYKLFNLDFKVGDASSEIFEAESVGAIVNSYILHEIFSGSRYNERMVSDTLRKQFKMLKKGGTMFIRDYARPPPEEFVLLEVPDEKSMGKDLAKLSDADLLVWYAEHARPKQDAGCGGFFLEELPERFPRTRLFRLPYKWAYEFIMRKDDRSHWEAELPMEYTFFTMREFRKELRALGARVQYSGPHYDEDIITEKFEGRFRLYQDNGTPLGNPPTCYISVAIKMAERKSLQIEERRPSTTAASSLKVTAMRNQNTGKIMDIVSRDFEASEILPYRVDEEGRLKVYLHDGVARSISNAVPRGGQNIDGRRWSGHLVEPITIDIKHLPAMDELDIKSSVLFARDHLGLKPQAGKMLEHGNYYYPAPEYIDERIHTFYLAVEENKGHILPKNIGTTEKFQAKGSIHEMEAQQILNAITVGMIPNARLEMQLLSLFHHLNLKPETWIDKKLNLQISKINKKADVKTILDQMGEDDTRFKPIKGTTGELRAVHSTFVEEGQSRGAMSGLSSKDVDFIVHDGKTVNTAVVLPLTKDHKNTVHAGIMIEHLPVPQRHEGNGLTVSAPSFNIPPEVTNLKLMKRFIAEQFGATPNKVVKLGESYFTHVGLTPHRIYPFAIASPPESAKAPDTKFIPFYQFMLLQRLLSKQPNLMVTISRCYQYFHQELRLDAKRQVKAIVAQQFEAKRPDWALPLSYSSIEGLRAERTVELNIEEKRELANQKAKANLKEQSKTLSQKHDIAPEKKPVSYAQEDITPEQEAEFEAELEEFVHTLEHDAPRPEKW